MLIIAYSNDENIKLQTKIRIENRFFQDYDDGIIASRRFSRMRCCNF